ncbi:MAG: hypothetical protein RL839_11350 [Gammaproteobacteria bacterium]
MAITAETRTAIIELVVTAYDAAPGTTLLNELVAIVDGGGTLADVAANLTTRSEWTTRYPSFLTAEEFANQWLGTLVPEASAAALAEGVAIAVGLVNGGASFADIITEASTFLSSASETDADFGTSAGLFNNKVAVAEYHTVTLKNTNQSAEAFSGVTSDDTTVTTANAALDGTASSGQTFTLTAGIDNLVGSPGNDIFITDNKTANAGDTLDGGPGTDTLKLFGTATLGNLTSIETVEVSNSQLDVNTSVNSGVTSVILKDTDINGGTNVVYTLGSGQTFTLQNISDSAVGGDSIDLAGSSTTRNLILDGVGTGSTADVIIDDVGGSAVASSTWNIQADGTATNYVVGNSTTTATVRTLNLSGTGNLTLDTASGISAELRSITNSGTGNLTATTTAAPSATTGMTITGGSGKDSITVDPAAAAGVINKLTTVDLGGGDDTLTNTTLTAATDIASGASFAGGDGSDTLVIANAAVINATTGKQFNGFETFGTANGTVDLDHLIGTNSIGTIGLGALAGGVVLNDVPESTVLAFTASTGAQTVAFNQKNAGAGSPDDVVSVSIVGSTTGSRTVNSLDVNDIETVNLSTSGGSTTTQTFTTLIADEATKVTAAAAAKLTIGDLQAASLVLFDGASSTSALSVTTGDAYGATSGVAFKGGSADDTFVLTGSTAGGAGLAFQMTGNGGSDTITLPAGGRQDDVVYLAQGDSTSLKYDKIGTFVSTEDKIVLSAFGFTGAAAGALKSANAANISIDGTTNEVVVATAARVNFFDDSGVDRGVALTSAAVGGNGYVFVDVDKNGDWDPAADLVIELTGTNTFVIGDVTF